MAKYKFTKELKDIPLFDSNGTQTKIISFKVGDIIEAIQDSTNNTRVSYSIMEGGNNNNITIELSYLEIQPEAPAEPTTTKIIDKAINFFVQYQNYFYIGGAAALGLIVLSAVLGKGKKIIKK